MGKQNAKHSRLSHTPDVSIAETVVPKVRYTENLERRTSRGVSFPDRSIPILWPEQNCVVLDGYDTSFLHRLNDTVVVVSMVVIAGDRKDAVRRGDFDQGSKEFLIGIPATRDVVASEKDQVDILPLDELCCSLESSHPAKAPDVQVGDQRDTEAVKLPGQLWGYDGMSAENQ